MIKTCARCGKSFDAVGHVRNVKYCVDCRYEAHLEDSRERSRRNAIQRREQHRRYYETHREQILEYKRIKRTEKKALKEAIK